MTTRMWYKYTTKKLTTIGKIRGCELLRHLGVIINTSRCVSEPYCCQVTSGVIIWPYATAYNHPLYGQYVWTNKSRWPCPAIDDSFMNRPIHHFCNVTPLNRQKYALAVVFSLQCSCARCEKVDSWFPGQARGRIQFRLTLPSVAVSYPHSAI